MKYRGLIYVIICLLIIYLINIGLYVYHVNNNYYGLIAHLFIGIFIGYFVQTAIIGDKK